MHRLSAAVLAIAITLLAPLCAGAHFGLVLPSDDIVEQGEPRTLTLAVRFLHPFEGHAMEMARPRAFGVLVRGARLDLTGSLSKAPAGGAMAWAAAYALKGPGDHTFYIEPEPYFEKAEGAYIIHYTKVTVNAFGLEDAWDAPAGLPVEIVPLTRPYGIWAGNLFTGRVLRAGKPVPGATVEVEYLNASSEVAAPAGPYVTQTVHADDRGVFSYAMPRAGWWGFAALVDADYTLKCGSAQCPVELGGVIWVRTREMR
jgi:cobalt/nickel transport protein